MTLFGEKDVPQEFDLSPTILTLVFLPTVGLFLTPALGMIEATFNHDSVLLTPCF